MLIKYNFHYVKYKFSVIFLFIVVSCLAKHRHAKRMTSLSGLLCAC